MSRDHETSTPEARGRSWRESRHAPLVTHGSLALLTAALFALLLRAPLAWAAVPCVILHHRVTILLHEYIHGIPLRRYRDDLLVLTVFEGLLLSFGFIEGVRAGHLAHHRWLNTERDPAFDPPARSAGERARRALRVHRIVSFIRAVARREVPYLRLGRVALGVLASLAGIVFWCAVGRPDVIVAVLALDALAVGVVMPMRAAVEHHNPGGRGVAVNDYRPLLFLFNVNRHVHHHREPRRPWYLLEYQTEPLPVSASVTRYYHAFIKGDYVLVPPGARSAESRERSGLVPVQQP